MAVTLTVAELSAALRLGGTQEETAEVTRLLAYATQAVAEYLGGGAFATAPEVVVNEAVIRIAAYLFDMPNAPRSSGHANALRNSGAGRILLPYRIHRAGYADALDAAQQAVGTDGNPVVGLSIAGTTLTVTFADGTVTPLQLPAGGVGVDTAAVRALIADWAEEGNNSLIPAAKLPEVAAQSRGGLVAVSDALPSGSLTDQQINIPWTPQAGYTVEHDSLLYIPNLRPSPNVIGLWAVALVNEVEVDETFIPWGPSGYEDDEDQSYHALSFRPPAGDHNIDVVYSRFPDGRDAVYLHGDEDEVPASSTVRIYLATAGVSQSTAPTPGGGDDAYSWATVGDTTLIPSTKYRTATSALKGAVLAVTNAIIDSDAHASGTLYGWSRSHVKRLIDRIVPTWARDTNTPIPASKLTNAPSGSGGGTRLYVQTDEPAVGPFALDDIWIRDVTATPLQIYKWTGSVWAVTYTLPGLAALGVNLQARGGTLPAASENLYNLHAVTALDGQWYYVQLTGHDADTVHWTWADLNDGQTDLAQFRGIIAENPFSIANPAVLDWAYISGEHRWVRRNSSTWIYASAPAQFDSRFRSQHSAQTGGLTTVGKFIFDSKRHQMRIIRAYNGAVPGAASYDWLAFEGPTLNIENWAFRDDSTRVQARKLGEFPQHEINQIPDNGEQYFRLKARVHKNATGTLTSYDLGEWEKVPDAGQQAAARPPTPRYCPQWRRLASGQSSRTPGGKRSAMRGIAEPTTRCS